MAVTYLEPLYSAGAAIKRGDAFYRMIAITGQLPANADAFNAPSTASTGSRLAIRLPHAFRAIEVGQASDVANWLVAYYPKDPVRSEAPSSYLNRAVQYFQLDPRHPLVLPNPGMPTDQDSSDTQRYMTVLYPMDYWGDDNQGPYWLDLICHLTPPTHLSIGRPNRQTMVTLSRAAGQSNTLINGYPNGYSNTVDAVPTITNDSNRTDSGVISGRRRVTVRGVNTTAQVTSWKIYGQRYDWSSPNGNTATLNSDLIYEHVTTGSANDFFVFALDNTIANYDYIGYKVTNQSGVTAMTGFMQIMMED